MSSQICCQSALSSGGRGREHFDVDGHLEIVLVRAQHHHRQSVACVRLRRQRLFEQRKLVVQVAQSAAQNELPVVHRQNYPLGHGRRRHLFSHACTVPCCDLACSYCRRSVSRTTECAILAMDRAEPLVSRQQTSGLTHRFKTRVQCQFVVVRRRRSEVRLSASLRPILQ